MNPIYIEYYSHEKCNCFKINLPWSKYSKDIMVLCKVSEGIEQAKKLAIEIITKHLIESLSLPIKEDL